MISKKEALKMDINELIHNIDNIDFKELLNEKKISEFVLLQINPDLLEWEYIALRQGISFALFSHLTGIMLADILNGGRAIDFKNDNIGAKQRLKSINQMLYSDINWLLFAKTIRINTTFNAREEKVRFLKGCINFIVNNTNMNTQDLYKNFQENPFFQDIKISQEINNIKALSSNIENLPTSNNTLDHTTDNNLFQN